jgi:hypothetical protein
LRVSRTVFVVATLAAVVPAFADVESWMEGTWARNARDCKKEGFTSRTYISSNDAKFGPLYDQYEHHCRIAPAAPVAKGAVLRLQCHEFWDDFQARKNAQSESVRLKPGPNGTLLIAGKRFARC